MHGLPEGAVTFLFTDIEGSTRKWEEHAEAMRVALRRHDSLLRALIAEHRGHVFKTVGDAFHAAFQRPADAVAASLAVQQALAAEHWTIPEGLRVRIALHTGMAEIRDGDYFGPTINRTARLLSAGHGGQVLVFRSTVDLAHETLPPGVAVRDLGQHRFKDLAGPEQVYQLVAPGLPAEFPPLVSLEAFPHNLPVQLSNFIGRSREIAQAKESLASARLLTLTGPGGAGKTRLALQVAADLLDEMPEGVWLAEFATLSDATLLSQTVAASLGIREHSERPILSVLTDYLQTRRVLLVFDNCEHVVNECAQLADQLLRACPHLKMLATSQAQLGVPGEVVLAVPPLSLPDPGALSTVDLIQSESVRLFVERAALTKPGFTVTSDNAAAVAQIVRRLDGIPLAIELAAARTKMMSVQQISERLDDRFRLLTAGGRTVARRQQTLQAAMDWSYDLLTEPERALLRRLSIFGGGWTLEAAEAVCADDGVEAAQILDLLGRLVDRSLVMAHDTDRGPTRYHMLETVRQYGQTRLRESGEDRQTRTRHRDWFLIVAERAERYLQGPDQRTWLDLLEVEHDNLRLALEWSKAAADNPEYLLRLAGGLWKFWEVRGYWTEGRMWLDVAIGKATGTATSSRIRVMTASATLAVFQGDFPRGVALSEESLELSRRLGDKRGTMTCLNILGLDACRLEQYDRAAELGNESLGLSQELGDWWGAVDSRFVLAFVARARGDASRASTLLEDIVSQVRPVGDRWRLAMALNNLGLVQRELGNYDRAQEVLEETLALTQDIGDKWGVAFARSNLAIVAWYRQDYARAAEQFAQSLRLRVEVGEKRGVMVSLVGLAAAAIRQGDAEHAALLFAGAEALREAIGVPPPPFIRGQFDQLLTETRAALGEKRFEEVWQKGRGLGMEALIDTALREPSIL